MLKLITTLLLLLTLTTSQLPKYNVALQQSSVSGISAGGFMATQFQIAHSSIMRGAGVIAGGPYACADGNISSALMNCMKYPAYINLNSLKSKAEKEANKGNIDSLEHLPGQKVYIYSGKKDTVVKPGVVKKLQEQYEQFGINNIVTEYNIDSEHTWATTNFGNPCPKLGEPYMSNCNYNTAQNLLNQIYENLNDPVEQVASNLIKFDQTPYLTKGDSMNSEGYIYVPTSCQNQEVCKIHISFHGCEQTLKDIGTDFVKNSGLNEFAESNNLIILYPQAKRSTYNPSNPNGCFDWWGYTEGLVTYGNISYATKNGVQIKSVYQMVQDLANGSSLIYE